MPFSAGIHLATATKKRRRRRRRRRRSGRGRGRGRPRWLAEEILPLLRKVRKTASFLESSLCLSRACLGKMIVLMYKRLKNAGFRSEPRGVFWRGVFREGALFLLHELRPRPPRPAALGGHEKRHRGRPHRYVRKGRPQRCCSFGSTFCLYKNDRYFTKTGSGQT